MSKIKSLKLVLEPLYLKICGRIVGAFSKMTIAIYIGFGLFTVSSLLAVFVFANLPRNSGIPGRQEKQQEEQLVAKSAQDQIIASAVAPVPKIVRVEEEKGKEQKEPKKQQKEVIAPPKSILGKIQLDFGWQNHPVYNDWRYHTGIDIQGKRGQEVQAVNKGQVIDIFSDRNSGLTVVVKDDTYHIYYGSLSEVAVEQGSMVNVNQVIGKMGSCTGEPYDHLHLAIKKDQHYVDPKLIISIKQ